MTENPGWKTTEFWMTAIGGLVAAVIPLLIAYNIIDEEQGQLWAGLILAVSGIVVPIVIGSMVKAYAAGRTTVKVEGIALEREAVALESLRLEVMESLGD